MDPADRIAAYLADELAPDQRRAFEADLERDAALRADLGAVRRADEALASAAPTPLPTGAAARLRERLQEEFDVTLNAGAEHATPSTPSTPTTPRAHPAPSTPSTPSTPRADPAAGAGPAPSDDGATTDGTFTATGGDELAARRARRTPPWTAIGGVAAALVAVVAVGQLGLGSGSDSVDEVAGDAAEDDSVAMMESAPVDGASGPVLRASERPLTDLDVEALLDDPQVRELAALGLQGSEAADAAAANAAAFGVGGDTVGPMSTDTDQADDIDDTDDLAGERGSPEAAGLRTEGDVDADTLAAVGRCLDVLLAGGGDPIVASAETVVYDGEDAVAFTLVGRDQGDVASRPEAWVLALDSCEVRYFTQIDQG